MPIDSKTVSRILGIGTKHNAKVYKTQGQINNCKGV